MHSLFNKYAWKVCRKVWAGKHSVVPSLDPLPDRAGQTKKQIWEFQQEVNTGVCGFGCLAGVLLSSLIPGRNRLLVPEASCDVWVCGPGAHSADAEMGAMLHSGHTGIMLNKPLPSIIYHASTTLAVFWLPKSFSGTPRRKHVSSHHRNE